MIITEQTGNLGSGRIFPLVNKTQVIDLTPDDLFRPAEFGLIQSTLPFFQVALNVAAFFAWIIILLYFWKIIYYPVRDPYATSAGSSPPNFVKKRTGEPQSVSLSERIYSALNMFS